MVGFGHTQINFQHYLLCLKVIFLEFCLTLFNSSGRFGHTKITFQHRNLCSKMSINITFLDFTQYCLTVVMTWLHKKYPTNRALPNIMVWKSRKLSKSGLSGNGKFSFPDARLLKLLETKNK